MTDHRVILGDCLDPVSGLASLPDKSVDHVITDPPYSDRVHRGFGTERRGDASDARGDISFSHLTARDRTRVAAEFVRVTRRWVVVFCDEESTLLWKVALERAGAEWCCKGTWLKVAPMPRMAGDRPAYGTEAICIAHAPREKGRTRWNGGGKTGVYEANAQEPGREHPTQKPLLLMEALVRDFTDAGDLILDPYAGSGTTLVAAKRLGRSGIGFERSPAYHAIAEKRIAGAREQFGLWTGAA